MILKGELDEIADKIVRDLKWRGPNKHRMAHVVLSRRQAAALLAALNYVYVEVESETKP